MQTHKELIQLRKQEKQVIQQIIEKLQEMESDRKYLKLGYSSLFDYLVRGLGYSESAAYGRQSCVRLSQEIPEIKEKIQSGSLTSTSIGMAFKCLKGKTKQEKIAILSKIENKPSRQVKAILSQEESSPQIHIQKTHYKDKVIFRLELSHEVNEKLEQLKALRAHCGSLEQLVEDLIDCQLKLYANTSFKPTHSKNPRFVSRTLRNFLLKKANLKCQYPGCDETHFLQVDHIKAVRNGGLSVKENLQILCGSHNRLKSHY